MIKKLIPFAISLLLPALAWGDPFPPGSPFSTNGGSVSAGGGQLITSGAGDLSLCSQTGGALTCTVVGWDGLGFTSSLSGLLNYTYVTDSSTGTTLVPAQTSPYPLEFIPNDATTGTTINCLAKLTTANPQAAIVTAGGETQGAIGVVTGNAGKTGNAQIQTGGIVNVAFSGSTTAGDYVSIDSGSCDAQDIGSTPTGGKQILGTVRTTNTGAGLYQMDLAVQRYALYPLATLPVSGINALAMVNNTTTAVSGATNIGPSSTAVFTRNRATLSATATITIQAPTLAGQDLILTVCIGAGGPFTATIAFVGGLSHEGTPPTFTTSANTCGYMHLYYPSTSLVDILDNRGTF